MMSRAQAARDALDQIGAELTWDMIDIALNASDAVTFSDKSLAGLAVKLRLTAQEVRVLVAHLRGVSE